MWLVHNCLVFHATCVPRSLVDLLEYLAAAAGAFSAWLVLLAWLVTR